MNYYFAGTPSKGKYPLEKIKNNLTTVALSLTLLPRIITCAFTVSKK